MRVSTNPVHNDNSQRILSLYHSKGVCSLSDTSNCALDVERSKHFQSTGWTGINYKNKPVYRRNCISFSPRCELSVLDQPFARRKHCCEQERKQVNRQIKIFDTDVFDGRLQGLGNRVQSTSLSSSLASLYSEDEIVRAPTMCSKPNTYNTPRNTYVAAPNNNVLEYCNDVTQTPRSIEKSDKQAFKICCNMQRLCCHAKHDSGHSFLGSFQTVEVRITFRYPQLCTWVEKTGGNTSSHVKNMLV